MAATAELVSSDNTLDGPTSVWLLSAPGNGGVVWDAHVVVRRPPPSPDVLVVKGVDVTGIATTGGTLKKPEWSSMAPEDLVTCAAPDDCGSVENPPEGWECLPVCTLQQPPGKVP